MWAVACWLIRHEVIAVDDLNWIVDLTKLATVLIVGDASTSVAF
jgi:hypothetical protein